MGSDPRGDNGIKAKEFVLDRVRPPARREDKVMFMRPSHRWSMCSLFVSVALTAPAQAPADHSSADHAKMHAGEQAGVASGGHMERRFDDAEQWTKEFDDPKRDEWQMPAKVLAALNLKPGQTVADLGAGTGYFTVRLAKT